MADLRVVLHYYDPRFVRRCLLQNKYRNIGVGEIYSPYPEARPNGLPMRTDAGRDDMGRPESTGASRPSL